MSDLQLDGSPAPRQGKEKQLLVGCLAFLAICFVGFGALCGFGLYLESSETTVYFVNGFQEEVEIHWDEDRSVVVAPYSMTDANISTGEFVFSSRLANGDRFIEEVDVEIPSFKDGVVYNVAGMAPAYLDTMVYYDEHEFEEIDGELYHTGETDEREGMKSLIGQRITVLDRLDFINEEPPDELYSIGNAIRVSLFYDGSSIFESLWQLDTDNGYREVIDIFPEIVEVSSLVTEPFSLVMDLSEMYQIDERWFEVLSDTTRDHYDKIWLNVANIRLQRQMGELGEWRQWYEGQHSERDTALSAFYLALVESDPHQKAPLFERASREDLQDPLFQEELGFYFARSRDCQRARTHLENARQLGISQITELHHIPMIRCRIEDSQAGAIDGLRSFLQSADDGYGVDYPLALFFARLVATFDHDPPLSASQVDREFFAGLGSYGDEIQELYLIQDGGLVIDDLFVEQMESYQADQWATHRRLNDAFANGEPQEILALYRQETDDIHWLLHDTYATRILVGFLALASEDRWVWNELLSRMENVTYIGPVRSAAQSPREIFDQLDFDVLSTWVDEPAPDHWAPEYRAAYYLTRALLQSSEEKRAADLEQVFREDPIWSPIHHLAYNMRER